MKKCNSCNKVKDLSCFYEKLPNLHKCRSCNNKTVSNYYNLNKKKIIKQHQKQYRTNDDYYKKRKYTDLLLRCRGRKTHKDSVANTQPLNWQEYCDWWDSNIKEFKILHQKWVISGYKKGYAPSIDRIDNKKGYLAENMRWLSHSLNTRKGNLERGPSRRQRKDTLSV